MMDRQCKGGHRINWTDIEGSKGDLTKDRVQWGHSLTQWTLLKF